MTQSRQTYPVCNLDGGNPRPEPAAFVVFGATGDLSHRKIFPALFDLHREGILPSDLTMIGFARKPLDEAEFRAGLKDACARHARHRDFSSGEWEAFASRISYLRSDLDDPAGYADLAGRIGGNALFYLAVGPEYFETISGRLGEAGLGSAHAGAAAPARPGISRPGWRRLVVEKPYGRNGSSARSLSSALQKDFRETDIYRIDHYLGKETVQNLLYLRFANSVFEPVWNRTHIERIEVSVFENEGIGQRGGYYDRAGAARDMLQNHLIQLLCLTVMEPPAGLEAENIRDEKVKVLKSVRVEAQADLLAASRRGQYRGYRGEAKVSPDSKTETYAALRLKLDNWRFSEVPLIIRTGKAFDRHYSQIEITFRRPPAALFAARCGDTLSKNVLTIRVQPDEGMYLRFNAKVPGVPAIASQELRFSYREVADYFPEAYERLIADALAGDSTLFIRADESEEAWRIIDALEDAWAAADPSLPPEQGGLFVYEPGSPVPVDLA